MGVTERKQREKKARIEAIKNSAKKLFAKKGYENTTMAEVAEETEIAKGTVYRFFKSKAELLFCLIEPMIDNYYQQVSEIIDNDEFVPADKTLAKLSDFIYEHFQIEPEPYLIMIYYKANEIEPQFSKERLIRLKSLMRLNLRKFEELLARGIEQKVFKLIDTKPAAIIIWNMILGILQFEKNRTYSEGKDQLKYTLDQAIKMLLSGLYV